jgi:hypothetical protein
LLSRALRGCRVGYRYLALEGTDELAVLREDGEVEVVVIVRNGDLAGPVDAHANGVVGNAFSADLTQEVALVVENLDTMGPVVRDEDLLPVVDNHAVGKFQMF